MRPALRTPAFALLRSALGRPRDTTAIAAAAAAPGLDWTEVMALSARHRIAGLLHAALSSAGAAPPEPHGTDLRRRAQMIRLAEWGYAAEAQRLQTLLADAGIQSIVLKGVVTGHLAFGELGLRENHDLDLLVAPSAVDAAESLLLGDGGYVRCEPDPGLSGEPLRAWRITHKDSVYRHIRSGRILELHWRLFDNPHFLPVGDDWSTQPYDLAPGLRVRSFTADYMLLYLCAHGAQHAWSRLKWLSEVAALFAAQPDQIASRLELARALRVERCVRQALRLCRSVLGMELETGSGGGAGRGDVLDVALENVALTAMTRGGPREMESLMLGSTAKNLSHYALGSGLDYLTQELRFDLTSSERNKADAELNLTTLALRAVRWGSKQARR